MWIFNLIIASPFLLAQVLFLALKGNWNWGVVFIPLYCLFLIGICITIYSLYKNQQSRLYDTFILICLLCAALFGTFLTIKLDLDEWPWAAVFAPIWSLLFVFAFYGVSTFTYWKKENFIISCVIWCHAIVLSVLLVLQLATPKWNWAIVFIPVWSFLFVWIVVIIFAVKKKLKSSTKARGWIELLVETIILASTIVFMILLVVSLNHVGHSIAKASLYSPLMFCFAMTFIIPYGYYISARKKQQEKNTYQIRHHTSELTHITKKTRQEKTEEEEEEERKQSDSSSSSEKETNFVESEEEK